MNSKKEKSTWEKYWWILPVILIVGFIVVIYKFFNNPKENTEKTSEQIREDIKIKHQQTLQNLLERRKQIYKRIERNFRIVYFSIRLIIVSIFLGINFFFFKYLNTELSTLINYNEIALILLFTTIYLLFGRLTTLKELFDTNKKLIETRIYGRYLNLPEKIEKNQIQLNRN